MVKFLALIVFASVLLLSLAAGDDAAARTPPTPAVVQPAVMQQLAETPRARVIVSLRQQPAVSRVADVAAAKLSVAAAQERVLGPLDGFITTRRYEVVPAFSGVATSEDIKQLARHPDVAAITLDAVGTIATGTSGPLVHAPEVHSTGFTGDGQTVAVLDTGIDTDHPDLADDIAYEVCFLMNDPCGPPAHPAEDDHSHGTNVSGIITSNGTIAPPGIAPDAKIAAYKVLGSGGNGTFADWTAALDDIIANHPEVDAVNMSLQSSFACPAGAMETAVNMLRQQGVPVFIATGNFGAKSTFMIPACIESSVAVGAAYDANLGSFSWSGVCTDATTAADKVTCWSNSSDAIDLIAPGARVTSTGLGNGVVTYQGTSQASPHAAAIATMLLEAFPGLSVDEIETRMEASGTLVTDTLRDSDPNTNRTTPRVDARVALLAPGNDDDGDGCDNAQEWGTNPAAGGLRNPLNPHDFYDTNGDRFVNLLDDILGVALAFGPDTGPNYHPSLDRTPPPPDADPWDLGPPDGNINIPHDILGAAAQFGHTCAG
jgi:subtilisin family serine protease